MSQAKHVLAAPVGEYIYVDLPNGGYVQIKTEENGVVVDIWSVNDNHITTCIADFEEYDHD